MSIFHWGCTKSESCRVLDFILCFESKIFWTHSSLDYRFAVSLATNNFCSHVIDKYVATNLHKNHPLHWPHLEPLEFTYWHGN